MSHDAGMAHLDTYLAQVQRYLGGESLAESRMGLLFNALIKVPMQFLVLMVGISVVVFHQFEKPPLLWNSVSETQARKNPGIATKLDDLQSKFDANFAAKKEAVNSLLAGKDVKQQVLGYEQQEKSLRQEARALARSMFFEKTTPARPKREPLASSTSSSSVLTT